MSAPSTPSTILILGTGVFGLTAAYTILQRPRFSKTRKVILVSPEGNSTPFAQDANTASIDSSRIIRADYADALYAELAQEAHELWREGECGKDGRYSEAGLLLTADDDSERGKQYVEKSFKNVQQQSPGAAVRLQSKAEIAKAMRAPGNAIGSGDAGYINNQSGWANAEACIRWLREEVEKFGGDRVKFIQDEAVRLLHDSTTNLVLGAELGSGGKLTADLTILATGAWTPKLLDMRGIASSRAQTLAYYKISETEADQLKSMPVHLNIGTGRFLFPPTRRKDGGYDIKAARHAYGFSNPVRIPAPLGTPPGEREIETSLPEFPPNGIPFHESINLTKFLRSSLPLLVNQEREPYYSRLCHYLDTPNGDFLVCHHPAYNGSLFVTTGGSGHAFKFLPVLGDKVVDVLEEGLDGSMPLTGKWATKWAWPKSRQADDEIWCEDGSRSGARGLTLQAAMEGDEHRENGVS